MTQPVKRLRMEHAHNMRDMGGYETPDGRVTAFGKLLRSGGLQNLTKGEWKRLKDLGICTVLDLRSKAEIEVGPDQVPEQITWRHCPLQTEQIDATDLSGSALKAFTDSLTEGYLNIVRNNGHLLAEALTALIDGLDRGAVLFHCMAGKDRTGVLASAIYYLCGVEREDIIADYEVTFTYNKRGMNQLFERADEEARLKMMPLLLSQSDSMDRLVAFYEEINLSEYLMRHGMKAEAFIRLKKHFLIPIET